MLADRHTAADELSELEQVVAAYGARLVVDDVTEAPGTARHDPVKLATAYSRIIGSNH